jgi:hypothetical protein
VKSLFLITILFLCAISLCAGLNNCVLIYNCRFCSNYPGNVLYSLNNTFTDDEFLYYTECNIGTEKDNPLLKTSGMIVDKMNSTNITREMKKRCERILKNISRVLCNGSVEVQFHSRDGLINTTTSFKSLYHYEYDVLCIRSIIDLSVIQVIFIFTLVICLLVLLLLGINLPDSKDNNLNESERDKNFKTLYSPIYQIESQI